MSAGVVGLTVRVTLKSRDNLMFLGIVHSVRDQALNIKDAYFPSTGKWEPYFVALGSDIADLEVVTATDLPPRPPPTVKIPIALIPSSVLRPAPRGIKKPTNFVDPAILSFARTATPKEEPVSIPEIAVERTVSNAQLAPEVTTLDKEDLGVAPRSILKRPNGAAQDFDSVPEAIEKKHGHSTRKHTKDGSSVFEGIQNFHNPVEGTRETAEREGLTMNSFPAKGLREKRPRGNVKPAGSTQVDFAEMEAYSPVKSVGTRRKKAPGWRETPLLEQQTFEDLAEAHWKEPTGKGRSKSRRQKRMEAEMKNGWATEDATDIQELGDFDFEANLSKFDKRSVFDQLKIEDTTAFEERLVSFNKAPPGTFGGRNLHPAENVLSEQMNGLDIAGKIDSELDRYPSGSTSSRRVQSRSRAASRQGSTIARRATNTPPTEGPQPSSFSLSRTVFSSRIHSPRAPPDGSHPTSHDGAPTLRYHRTNKPCHPTTPAALASIEAVAQNISGLSEDILSENAGRGIADVALAALNPGGRRLTTGNHNAQPVVVVLVGDNRAGARALAAARHLAERGVRIVACTTGPDTSNSDTLGPQIQRLGKGYMLWAHATAYLKTLNAPPELIIDGLLDAHATFDALDDASAAMAGDMMDWANRSKASVLAVDIPSGVDASTGEVQVVQGEPVEVRAKMVACCGAPVVGLLRAMEARHAEEEGVWRVWIVDIGINGTWRDLGKGKNQVRGGSPVEFGSEWVVGVVFDAGGA